MEFREINGVDQDHKARKQLVRLECRGCDGVWRETKLERQLELRSSGFS